MKKVKKAKIIIFIAVAAALAAGLAGFLVVKNGGEEIRGGASAADAPPKIFPNTIPEA